MPKVSVVISTYNRSEFLRRAILSVVNQTYQDFEIIIVDDASTDNTIDIISTLNSKKIKYIRHEYNKGEAETRNTGILNTNGQYIAFLDDDDEWLPEKLELQIDKIEDSAKNTGLIYTAILCFYHKENRLGKKSKNPPLHQGNMFDVLMKKNIIITPSTVLIKRKCIEKIGLFDSAIAFGLDWDFWIRISKHFDFEYLSEPLVRYRIHENRLSNNNELRVQGRQDLAKKYGKQIITSKYWKIINLAWGIDLCSNKKTIKGIKFILRYIRDYPTSIKGYIYLGISLLGSRYFNRVMSKKDQLLSNFDLRKIG